MSCSINLTIFSCRVLDLCQDVAAFFSSPHCNSQQGTEWREFFKPAIRESLSGLFIKRSSECGKVWLYVYTSKCGTGGLGGGAELAFIFPFTFVLLLEEGCFSGSERDTTVQRIVDCCNALEQNLATVRQKI